MQHIYIFGYNDAELVPLSLNSIFDMGWENPKLWKVIYENRLYWSEYSHIIEWSSHKTKEEVGGLVQKIQDALDKDLCYSYKPYSEKLLVCKSIDE